MQPHPCALVPHPASVFLPDTPPDLAQDNSTAGIRATLGRLSQMLRCLDEELWEHLEKGLRINPQFYAFRWALPSNSKQMDSRHDGGAEVPGECGPPLVPKGRPRLLLAHAGPSWPKQLPASAKHPPSPACLLPHLRSTPEPQQANHPALMHEAAQPTHPLPGGSPWPSPRSFPSPTRCACGTACWPTRRAAPTACCACAAPCCCTCGASCWR